jgi:hypothetical protein
VKKQICICFVALLCAALCVAAQTGAKDKRYLNAVANRAEFDLVARTYLESSFPLPHVMFVVDRQDKNKIYYVNSKKYAFHKDFVNGNYLSLERGREFFVKNYINANRRFILGTLAYQTPLKRWTYEFWEGDQIPAEQIKLVSEVIAKTFYEPVAFKPNSVRQEELAAGLPGLAVVLQNDILEGADYQPLNVASGIGRVHIIDKIDEHTEIGYNEILVLSEVPVTLPPVAGIIITKPSTPLSHINLLAKSWGVPNAYIRDAASVFKQYNERWVVFDVEKGKYRVRPAQKADLDKTASRDLPIMRRMTPKADLEVEALADLRQQRARSVTAYGAKSANLGEVFNARLRGVTVPNGFTIPFYWYDKFMRDNGFDKLVEVMLEDQRFVHDPAYRRDQLDNLRKRLQQGKFDAELQKTLLAKVRAEYQDEGLFVRSSTNSEDLPNFNGAGLYDTVPNVKGDEKLLEAIKTVWASLWNFRAYEARERAFIPHDKVYMAVLIQTGVNSEKSGVMITANPYDREDKNAIYINAKKGLGERVVSGTVVGEQIVFYPLANSAQVLTRSKEDSQLVFSADGGLVEAPIVGSKTVMPEKEVRRLAAVGQQIKRLFKGKDQDIEFGIVGANIYILQSRPYIDGSKQILWDPLAAKPAGGGK